MCMLPKIQDIWNPLMIGNYCVSNNQMIIYFTKDAWRKNTCFCFHARSITSIGWFKLSTLHEHNLPSVDILIKLCAFWLPTTVMLSTGWVWACDDKGLWNIFQQRTNKNKDNKRARLTDKYHTKKAAMIFQIHPTFKFREWQNYFWAITYSSLSWRNRK